MSNITAVTIQFNAQLIDSIAQLGQFIQLLERERELLTTGETEALLELAQSKQAASRRLQDAENARALMLSRNGQATDREGVMRFVSRNQEALGTTWRRYQDMARQANEMNRENGIYIREQMRNNQQALAVLLTAAAPSLYDEDGLTPKRPGGSRFSDRA